MTDNPIVSTDDELRMEPTFKGAMKVEPDKPKKHHDFDTPIVVVTCTCVTVCDVDKSLTE